MGRRLPSLVLLLALLLTACGTSSSAGGGASGYSGRTLLLGAVLSKTGPGAVYGPFQQRGIDLAVEDINGGGGIDGAKVSVRSEDDGSSPQQAAQVFQTLIQSDRVAGLIGPTLSNSAVAAHQLADQLRTPVVAVSNTGDGIVGSCPYPCTYIFRDSLGEADAIPANVRQFVSTHHPGSAAILYANDDKFSSDGEAIFKRALNSERVRIADEVAFSKNEVDFRSFATTAIGAHPDVVVISALGGPVDKLIPALRAQGYAGPILGGNGFNTYPVSKGAGPGGRGAQSAAAYFAGTQAPANTSFVQRYRSRYGELPDQFAAQAYTGVLVVAQAARMAGLSFADVPGDRSRLRDALGHVSLDTPLGRFSFTRGHDVRQPIYIVAMDGAGGFTLVTTVNP